MHLDWGKPDLYRHTIEQMAEMLDTEKPDLAVFTGDIVTDGLADSAWRHAFAPLTGRNIPFVVAFGNHDREQELTAPEMADIIMSYPTNLNTACSGTLDDQAMEIWSSDGSKVAALVYSFDSNDYSTERTRDYYGWFSVSQVQNYIETSRKYTAANAGVPLPALAFFHIALLEHAQAYNEHHTAGVRGENECPGNINTGMFGAFHECGDVMGVFVGHDHDNDYTASRDGLVLGFGCFSGSTPPWGKTTYTNYHGGVRVFEMKEGEHSFTTWKRDYSGEEFDHETFTGYKDYTLRKASKPEGSVKGISLSTGGAAAQTVSGPHIGRDEGGHRKYVYDGYLDVPQSGLWSLQVICDGNGILKIDDVTISELKNSGQCNFREVNLEKGLHPVHIEYESINKDQLFLRWHPVACDRFLPIPDEHWYIK